MFVFWGSYGKKRVLIFVFLQQKIIAYQCEISKNVMIFVKVEKTFFPFFFERFDRNLIASSLFQKNQKNKKKCICTSSVLSFDDFFTKKSRKS